MLQLASPNIDTDDIAAVVRVLKSGMLVQGGQVAALEAEIATYLGVEFAVAASNGTATLHLALTALGIGPGDEVIVPSFSYVATANVVELVGAKPVFVDIERRSFNIDFKRIAAAVTPRTKAVIPVHEFGLPCDIESVAELCREKGLALIEDAACAMGSKENGRFTGTFGDFGSFSLHPRKAVTSGEGGILITSDTALAARVRILRNHGMEIQDGRMEFIAAGFNYRMTDFQAALVRGQLARLPDILRRRAMIADRYLTEIRNPLIILPQVPAHKSVNWQTFHVLIRPEAARDAVIEELRGKGIATNYGAQCIPAQKYYQKKYGLECEAMFPCGWEAWRRGLAIPAHEKLSDDDVTLIISALNAITTG